jgi:enoyl-CoA hydratase
MAYQRLRLAFEDRIARLTLTSTVMDAALLDELPRAAEAISAQDNVSVVLLDADGPDFCPVWAEDAIERRLQPDAPADPFGCLADLPQPVIAPIRGRCHDAGLELALACDIRLAASDATFAMTGLSTGLPALAGGSQRLPRIAGRTRATSMLLLGDVLDAESAQRTGLISRVLPNDTFEADSLAVARTVASRGPIALHYAKEAVHQGMDMPLDQAVRLELDFSIILQTTADRAEGIKAFLEKRKANFEGR